MRNKDMKIQVMPQQSYGQPHWVSGYFRILFDPKSTGVCQRHTIGWMPCSGHLVAVPISGSFWGQSLASSRGRHEMTWKSKVRPVSTGSSTGRHESPPWADWSHHDSSTMIVWGLHCQLELICFGFRNVLQLSKATMNKVALGLPVWGNTRWLC